MNTSDSPLEASSGETGATSTPENGSNPGILPGIGAYRPVDIRDRSMWQRLAAFCALGPQAFGRAIVAPDTKGAGARQAGGCAGHVTGSAFVLSPDLGSVLLTHHAKLDRWLQLGGHCDGDCDVAAVALREAQEESGLGDLVPLWQGAETGSQARVFDVDIHKIPARPGREAAHYHYDVRYLFRATDTAFRVSAESRALAWVPLGDLQRYSGAQSVLLIKDKLIPYLEQEGLMPVPQR